MRNFYTYSLIHSLSRGWPLVSLNIWWAFQWAKMGCSVLHWLVFVQFVLVCLVSTDRVARLVTLSQSNVRQGLDRRGYLLWQVQTLMEWIINEGENLYNWFLYDLMEQEPCINQSPVLGLPPPGVVQLDIDKAAAAPSLCEVTDWMWLVDLQQLNQSYWILIVAGLPGAWSTGPASSHRNIDWIFDDSGKRVMICW